MKKRPANDKYRQWLKGRLIKNGKKLHKRKLLSIKKKINGTQIEQKIFNKVRNIKSSVYASSKVKRIKLSVYAPSDFRLINNTEGCLLFFRDLRSDEFLNMKMGVRFVIMSLKNVTQIDYGTISILTAIGDELKSKNIILKGDLPNNPACRLFMINSGYLNNLFDEHVKPFSISTKSDLLFFEKGSGKLTLEDNIKISKAVKNVVNYLTGESSQCLSVKTIVLEICGNSIEWSGTNTRQWLLGVEFESERVVFTATDLGRGIFESLHRKFKVKLANTFLGKSCDEILKGAFDHKYGSSTQEVNRNKGLPAVKFNFEQDRIRNLKVLTNNVILHFDDDSLSRTFKKGSARFKGTFYQWEMTKECINNIITS